MSKNYDFLTIEKKWREYWDQHKIFKVAEDPSIPEDKRLYVLDMFPYPSGSGLHVGHPEGYTATDIYCRYKKMSGYNVLHPMGFDAFGLPAENYAIQTGTHPSETTYKNIDHFRGQIKALGFCYDWDREISTCDADYYKWTQWIFLQLFKKGLAYEAQMPINWCPKCGTGLANEEVKDGRCDRCDTPIERKNIRQWILKITAYAERLLKDLDVLDWNDSIKLMQENWIGKSEGAEVDFEISGLNEKLRVFTTRPDTLFGATYMVLAPEHPLVGKLTTPEQKKAVESYIKEASRKSDLQRTELNKEKSGVFTGAYAINSVNQKQIPIWISDYVLISYGTGAIMAVPAHDERDFEFAKKFGLPIIQVVSKDGSSYELQEAESTEGFAIGSGKYNGMKTADFKKAITEDLEKQGKGKKTINYKLRDWVFSRQRYWGEPIPIVHCEKCGIVPLEEKDLPLKLPEVKTYKPTGTGESPLALIEDWVNTTCPKCGGRAKRETNTMPQWAGSCWYYIRFTDPRNDKDLASKSSMEYWLPVDLYIGGAEHAVLHLLYARFWHKFLYDSGVVNTIEPFMTLRNQGMVLGENGEKMSKSRGNVINPDDVIAEHGADTLRIYEMFMGPLSADKPWNTQGIIGLRRFLEKVFRLFDKEIEESLPVNDSINRLLHKTIKIVGERIDSLEFNTAISQMMVFTNALQKEEKINKSILRDFVKILHPFAPFVTEEMWEMLGERPSVLKTKWPSYREELTQDEKIAIAVQENGKLRDTIFMSKDVTKQEMEEIALNSDKMKKILENKEKIKVISVPGKVVNVVTRIVTA
jgi:leucyl-tRNA synthetase